MHTKFDKIWHNLNISFCAAVAVVEQSAHNPQFVGSNPRPASNIRYKVGKRVLEKQSWPSRIDKKFVVI
jgi:hypothetical protein